MRLTCVILACAAFLLAGYSDVPKDVDELKEYMGMLEKKDEEKATLISKIKSKLKGRRSKNNNK